MARAVIAFVTGFSAALAGWGNGHGLGPAAPGVPSFGWGVAFDELWVPPRFEDDAPEDIWLIAGKTGGIGFSRG